MSLTKNLDYAISRSSHHYDHKDDSNFSQYLLELVDVFIFSWNYGEDGIRYLKRRVVRVRDAFNFN